MITYQNNKIWQRPWFLAIVGCTAIAGAAWWWTSHGDSPNNHSGNVASTVGGWLTPSTGASGNAATQPGNNATPLLAQGRPTDLPESDWNALTGALSKQPGDAQAEAARVVDYLRYQKRFEYWQTTEGNKSAKERAALAQALLDEIPARLAKGEFTTAEAVLMNTVLITESEPNETARQQRIAAMQEQLLKSAPPQDNEKLVREADRNTEAKRLVATTFAEWQAKPEASRTQATLEAALANAQRSFNAGGAQ
ncbi:MAG: hypothetical protein KGL57_09375 [Burkholderiales bacterium]|nr:hypothetical protein [Burkholderiales bacterium]